MKTTQPICVLGVGLIGGSLIRAATNATHQAFGWNRSALSAKRARIDGFDVTADLPKVLQRAQECDAIIVISVPHSAVDTMCAAIAEHTTTCTVTDAVSIKQPVIHSARAHGLADRFVGGHPMAGTQFSGWQASSATLFRDATWVVTIEDDTNADAFENVVGLAELVGSHVVACSALDHDKAAARISHVPHIFAHALAAASLTPDITSLLALRLGAGSFTDGTRVAATHPDLAREICEPNVQQVDEALTIAVNALQQVQQSLRTTGQIGPLFDIGHDARMLFETVKAQGTSIEHDFSQHVVVDTRRDNWRQIAKDAGTNGLQITLGYM